MNRSNSNFLEVIKKKLDDIREFIAMYLRILLPVAIALVTLIVILISVSAHNAKKARQAQEEAEAAAKAAESQLSADTAVVSVPEVLLEENAYPEVNELMENYFKAMASGDIETIRSYNNNVDDTESIRIEETAKYIESYDSLKVYTKIGPAAGTYLAYVYYEEKFLDYESSIPGLEAFYICTDENGRLYINDGEESESVINYIREASLQDDVVDLNNEVASAYNNMLAENDELSVFLVDLTESIDTAVGESLAQAEGEVAEAAEEETTQTAEETTAQAVSEVVTTVRATTTVNIRSSDSETADKLGKASEGQEFKLVEARGNGWSEIEYNGKNAFIKSEYLENVATETMITVADNSTTQSADNGKTDTNTNNNTNTASADSGKTTVSGTVTVKENVRIRSEASTESEKLATAYVGQKLDVIEKLSNGWTKVKFEGKTGYVKSEFVE